MIVEFGHLALILAFVTALIQSFVPAWGAYRGDLNLMMVGRNAAILQAILVGISFAALAAAFYRSDFSVELVWQHSHSLQPAIYKITGTWGNHEGSMLLWVLILAIFGMTVAIFGRNLPPSLNANVLSVQGWITVAFLGFILFTSNPFDRLENPPLEGRDLNPVLQDMGLAIHPPLLYLGYVGFSITFAFAVAALIEGKIDAAWARWVRPWALAAWVFLTLGIAMGSYWAYYELGWGGWWFWDPVENASFMPWLAGTALLHSALVMERRDALKIWTVLLAILTFSLSLLGTFLVRSGILTSVHSFASDPGRGLVILVILVAFIGGSLSLFALRASHLKAGGLFSPVSREGALVLNNILLTVGCACVLVGTLYPLALEMITGTKISVGEPFFNLTFAPLMLPLLFAMPFGPFLAWKRGDIFSVMQRLWYAAFAVGIVCILSLWLTQGNVSLALVGLGLAIWLMVGSISELLWRGGIGRQPVRIFVRRLFGLPGSAWGTAVAHFGVGVMVLGIVVTIAGSTEEIAVLEPSDELQIAHYDIRFDGVSNVRGPNFREQLVSLSVMVDGKEIGQLTPSKRHYEARDSNTTEAAIRTTLFSQLYISVGDIDDEIGTTIRAYHKPLVTLVWLGAIVMAVGGCISLFDRRLRIGVAKLSAKSKRRAALERAV